MGDAESHARHGWNNGPPPGAESQGLAWRGTTNVLYAGGYVNPNWIGSMGPMRPPPPPALPQNVAWPRPPPPHYQGYAPLQQQVGMMPGYGTEAGVYPQMHRVQGEMRMHANGRGGYPGVHHHQGRRMSSSRPMYPRPYLSSRPPAQKRKRKKDIVPPLEPMKEDAKVREPVNEAERREIEAWKAERRKHWPSEANIRRKEEEAGEDDRRISLMQVLDTQKKMGLVKKAGTEELVARMRCGRYWRHDQRHQGQHKHKGTSNAEMLGQVDPGSEGLLAIQGYSSGEDAAAIQKEGNFEEKGGEESVHLEKRQCSSRGKAATTRSHEYRGQRNRKSSLLEKLLEKDIRLHRARVAQFFTFIYMNEFLEGENKEYKFPNGTRDARGEANSTNDDCGDNPETESSSSGDSSDHSDDEDDSSSDRDDCSDD
eukprot:jgi/Picsp_1/6404/NSC_03752-R1_hypothetical protein CHLNCDRAFT_52119 [Chlorella variabilis]